MELLKITVGPFLYTARLELENAPKTCKRFAELLPFENQTIHGRWSGEAIWVPLGEFETGLVTITRRGA